MANAVGESLIPKRGAMSGESNILIIIGCLAFVVVLDSYCIGTLIMGKKETRKASFPKRQISE
jgi:hypothetical protein